MMMMMPTPALGGQAGSLAAVALAESEAVILKGLELAFLSLSLSLV
jgi:hypothetical protein